MDKRSFFFVPKLDADGDLLCRLLGIAEPPCPIEILQSFPTCFPPPQHSHRCELCAQALQLLHNTYDCLVPVC